MVQISFRKSIKNGVPFVIILFLLLTGMAFTQSSEHYTLRKSAVSQAGGASSSATYSLQDAVGQSSVIGNSSSTNYALSSGFFGEDYTTTSVDEAPEIDPNLPTTFQLKQNYPNPFNPETTIRFDLARYADVDLNIYDITGRHICHLFTGSKERGTYQVKWNGLDHFGRKVASGVYFYRIEITSSESDLSKMIYIRKMILIQ